MNFVGQYANDIADAIVAAVASRNHLMLVGAPGKGKTSIAAHVGERIFNGSCVMTRFNPTTGPEKVYGAFDMDKWLNGNQIGYITDGTPYAADCKVWIADEAVRANDALLDAFVEVLDMWSKERMLKGLTQSSGPITILTANFLPKGERVEAFLDRIGLNMWVDAPDLDVRDIVRAQAKARTNGLTIAKDMPTAQEIEAVWTTEPTDRAIEAVAETIAMIAEMAHQGLTDENGKVTRVFTDINPRRISQWTNLLTGLSILYAQTADFNQVHPNALRAMRYAWVSKTAEEARDWATMIDTVADPVTAMVDMALQKAYAAFNSIKDNESPAVGMTKIGRAMADATNELLRYVSENDARYIEAATKLNEYFSEIVKELSSKR